MGKDDPAHMSGWIILQLFDHGPAQTFLIETQSTPECSYPVAVILGGMGLGNLS